MTKIYPTQSPWEYYRLADASYKKGKEQKFINQHLKGYEFLESKKIDSWKFDIYKDKEGKLIVSFRGSYSGKNWIHNAHQQFKDPKKTFEKIAKKRFSRTLRFNPSGGVHLYFSQDL